jgi:ligand-binding sensor domain-containing protein
LISDDVTALAVDTQDRVWVGTAWGVSTLHPDGTWTFLLDEYPHLTEKSYSYTVDPTNAIAVDKQGRVWIAHWTILTAIDPSGNVSVYPLWYSDLKYISDITVDPNGRLWLGSAYDGLKVVDLNNGVPKPVSENWINARAKLLLPLQTTVAFGEPIMMWIFLPAQFGPVTAILFFVCLAGIIFGVMGKRRGVHESNRSMVNFSRLILGLSTVGALLLWIWACLIAFMFLRD